MPQSLASLFVHAVFSTKQRHPFLADPMLRAEIHAYVGGVTGRLDCPPIAIGGADDHVHALVRLSRTISVADWIKEVKRVPSIRVKQLDPRFAWQGGYGVFTVDVASLDRVAAYVRMQEEHHRKLSFQDEFRQLMAEHRVGRTVRVGLIPTRTGRNPFRVGAVDDGGPRVATQPWASHPQRLRRTRTLHIRLSLAATSARQIQYQEGLALLASARRGGDPLRLCLRLESQRDSVCEAQGCGATLGRRFPVPQP